MRNIIDGLRSHNAVRTGLAAAALFAALLAGCGSSEDTGGSTTCGVAMDTSAWEAFLTLGSRLESGAEVPRGELEAFAEVPGVLLWRESLAPRSPAPANVGNWLEVAFGVGDDARRGKVNANRRLMGDSYRYSWANRAEVDTLLAGFRREGACRLADRTAFWIEPGNLPAGGLAVVFLPALSEIRIARDTLVVDTGVLVAGGLDQAVDQMVSLLYRNYQAIPGLNPAELEGKESVAQSFRVITNEGVAGWAARTLDTEFRADHPRLGRLALVPETFYETALRVMEVGAELFPALLADPEAMAARGRSFTEFLMGQNGFGQLGYAMASVIEARLGEERLRDAGRTVPGFLAAYQEAALMNPSPPAVLGAPGTRPYEAMPPFTPGIYEGLLALLRESFPPE